MEGPNINFGKHTHTSLASLPFPLPLESLSIRCSNPPAAQNSPLHEKAREKPMNDFLYLSEYEKKY